MPDGLREHCRSTAGADAREVPVPGEDTPGVPTGNGVEYMLCAENGGGNK